MNIISIYNQKGGTGKTSFSALLGKYAASQGEPTLLIDLDPQESLTETFSIKAEKTAFHWLTGQAAIREVVYKISENLFIIPGDIQLIKIQGNIRERQLKREMERFQYKNILIDNSPTFNSLIISAIYASDKILIPTLLSEYDLKSLEFTTNEIRDINQEAEKFVVFNRQNKQTKELETIIHKRKTIFHDCNTAIFPNSVGIRKLIDRNKPIDSNEKLYKEIAGLFNFLHRVL